MTILTRGSILAADDLPFEDVPVPEWGGVVRVRCMTGTDRASFQASLFEGEGEARHFNGTHACERVLVRSIVDEANQRIFSDSEEDVLALSAKNGTALARLYDVAQRLSALGGGEDAVKN